MKLLFLISLFLTSFSLTMGQSYGFTPYYGLGVNPFTSPLYGYGLSLTGYGGYGAYGGYGGYYGRNPYLGYGYYPYLSRSDSQINRQNT